MMIAAIFWESFLSFRLFVPKKKLVMSGAKIMMPAKEAKESSQPRSIRNIGLMRRVMAAVIRRMRQGSNFLPTYQARRVRMVTMAARVIEAVQPMMPPKMMMKRIEKRRLAKRESLPKRLLTRPTMMPR